MSAVPDMSSARCAMSVSPQLWRSHIGRNLSFGMIKSVQLTDQRPCALRQEIQNLLLPEAKFSCPEKSNSAFFNFPLQQVQISYQSHAVLRLRSH
jgi:hypothetical protein